MNFGPRQQTPNHRFRHGTGLPPHQPEEMHMAPTHPIAGLLALLFTSVCSATTPLSDLIDNDGVWGVLTPRNQVSLDLQENEKTQEIRRQERCSAIGAPKGKWRIVNGRLWLVALIRCGSDIKLETVYGGTGEPIFAEWITADLVTQQGKQLCRPWDGVYVLAESIFLRVERGIVMQTSRVSNRNHPAIPTVEILRKILGPTDAHHAEELLPDWSCIDEYTLRRHGYGPASAPNQPNAKGSTYGEHLYDHAKKLIGQ